MSTLLGSRYNVVVPLKRGRALAHNALSGALALLEEHEYRALREPGDGQSAEECQALSHLSAGGFLVSPNVDELEQLQGEYAQVRADESSLSLTIAPTLACNFGCDYCFQGTDKPSEMMPPNVQDALLTFVQRQLPHVKGVYVCWYGGEPLLAKPIVDALSDRLIAECEAASVAYEAMMISNGYKLTAKTAKELVARRVRTVQVTLDGDAGEHDQRRTLLGGQPTFQKIVDNLRQVVTETALRVVVRINVDQRNAGRIESLLGTLREQGLSGRRNFSVYFAPVEAITEGCHSVASVCMTKAEYGALETRLQERALRLGLGAAPYPTRFLGTCVATRKRGYVVVPNGDVHKCWDTVSMPTMAVGSIFGSDPAESAGAKAWTSWTPFDNATCRSCKILPHCAGACAHKSVNPEQTKGEAGSLPCPSWKYQLKERLVLHAIAAGILSEDDVEPGVATDPSEICPLHVTPPSSPSMTWKGGPRLHLRLVEVA